MNPAQEILTLENKIPKTVFEDVKKRSSDWILSGGLNDDPYVHQQLNYAKRFLKENNHEEN